MNDKQIGRVARAACTGVVVVSALVARPAHGAANFSMTSSKDNTLIEGDPGFDYSNGTGPLYVGEVDLNGNDTNRRALLKFDLASALPPGSWIHSASLTLTLTRSHFVTSDVSLYRVSADWGEGTSNGLGQGAPATPADATWFSRFFGSDPATPWNRPGGDFVSQATATVSMGFPGSYTFMTNDVTGDVQRFMDTPATNFGWLLKDAEDTPGTAKELASREYFDPTSWPNLQINYTMGGDADDNNAVDLTDFTILAANFNGLNKTFAEGDFSRDGKVDLTDFTILASNFNRTAVSNVAPTGAAVPEPGVGGVIGAGVMMLVSRRRRRA